jgi:predicted porin
MKPTSIGTFALLAALCGGACAQSTVTIYGIVDVGFNKGNGGTATNAGANGTSQAWIAKSATSSRLGFRGSEDLGGGLYAQFELQHRFNPDDGTTQTPFYTGKSIVQLFSRSLGTVYLGRTYMPAFGVGVRTDPFGLNGVGQVTSFGGYRATDGLRTSNTVGYITPSFSGLTVQAAGSAGEGVAGRDTGAAVEYSQGPLYIGAATDRISGGPVATSGNSVVNLGVTYNFGFVMPMAYYARAKLGVNGATSGSYYTVGATAPIGPGLVKLVVARLSQTNPTNHRTKVAGGYNHNLSKRTYLYVDLARAREDNKTTNSVYSLGVTHSF